MLFEPVIADDDGKAQYRYYKKIKQKPQVGDAKSSVITNKIIIVSAKISGGIQKRAVKVTMIF